LSFTHKKLSRGNNTDSLWGDGLQLLKEEEPEKYQAHFSGLLKEGFEADDLAEMYTSVHAAIHADPSAHLTEKNAPTEKKIWKMKLSYEERKAALISQLNALNEEV
jgi:large subunit ribosomal protein L5e